MACATDDPQLRRAVCCGEGAEAASALAAARRAACCDAEPMCALCPLRPENAARSLADLKAAGLRGRLPELGL